MLEEIEVRGLDDTLAMLRLANREHFGDELDSPWVFRGLRNPEWKLIPKVWRPDFLTDYPSTSEIDDLVGEVLSAPARTDFDAELVVFGNSARTAEALTRLFVEYQLLRNFSVIAEEADVQTFPARDDLRTAVRKSLSVDDWVRTNPDGTAAGMAQHYGVPTRLLDWSRDPLTALHFALQGDDGGDESTVWALAGRLPTPLPRPIVSSLECRLCLIEPSRRVDRRIGSQSGNFTFIQLGEAEFILAGQYPDVSDLVEENRTIRRYRIKLSPEERLAAKKVLFRERRTMAHLMPDLRTSWELAEDYYRSGLRF
jgi:hypothetical protein